MEKIKSYSNTQLPDNKVVFPQIAGLNTDPIDYNRLKNQPTIVVTAADVWLWNVDNTSDANKPVSTAQQTALNLKANIASQAFTGTPSLPTGTTGVTQSAGNSTTALATTAFVTTADNLKANLAWPTFTGTVYASWKFRLPVGSNLY